MIYLDGFKMAKRRKLSKEYESKMALAQKETELILAKINDIEDDDIRVEYTLAFAPIKSLTATIISNYKSYGFTEESEQLYNKYNESIDFFKKEYEI